jgi:hypothetical protein
MPASVICQGVTKSGSPIPSEITSSIEESRSKNLLMPDGGSVATFCETTLSGAPVAVDFVFGMLRCYWQASICFLGEMKGFPILFVAFEKEMRDRTLHLF